MVEVISIGEISRYQLGNWKDVFWRAGDVGDHSVCGWKLQPEPMNKRPENTSIQGNSPLAECWASGRDLLRERAFKDTLRCVQKADGCETRVLQSESEFMTVHASAVCLLPDLHHFSCLSSQKHTELDAER